MVVFDRPNITDPERKFHIFRNASGGVLARGTPVIINTATIDGVGVALAGAGLLSMFAGISFGPVGGAAGSIFDGEYGNFQWFGYCDYALVANHPSVATIIGDAVGLVSTKAYLQRIAAGDGLPKFAISLENIPANAVITPAARKVMLGL
jgi:hypothetical protein